MKPWQLLVFLLLSDLSPPTDGDWIMDYFRWRLCRKERLKVALQTACLNREYKTMSWVSKTPKDQTLQDIIGAILRTPTSAPPPSHFPEEEKLVPVLRVVSETRHTSMDVIRSSKSVWLHRHFMASGLEESKSRSPVTAAHLCLTERCSQAKVASCCPHDGKMRSEPRLRAADVKKRLSGYRQRPVIRWHDTVRAAQLHAGLPVQTPDMQVKGSAAAKANLKVHEDFSPSSSREEGVSVLRQLLLVSRKNKGSKNSPQYVIRPDDNEYFSGKIITKESEPPVLRGDGKPAKSHWKTAEKEKSLKTDRLKYATSEALMEIFLQETQTDVHLEGLFDFPPTTDFLSGAEKSKCRCSDGEERSAEKGEGINSADEDEEVESELSEAPDSSSVSNYKADNSPPPTTSQTKMTETTATETTTTKIPETTTRDKETTTGSEVSARLVTFTAETTTTNLLSGLRMKDNIRTSLMDDTNGSRPDQKTQPSKPVRVTQKESLHPEAEPLCGGLIARSEAGRKHCMERLGIAASRRFSSTETPDVRRREEGSDPRSDDGNHHFYYFDGVIKKVPGNSDPSDRRQRL